MVSLTTVALTFGAAVGVLIARTRNAVAVGISTVACASVETTLLIIAAGITAYPAYNLRDTSGLVTWYMAFATIGLILGATVSRLLRRAKRK